MSEYLFSVHMNSNLNFSEMSGWTPPKYEYYFDDSFVIRIIFIRIIIQLKSHMMILIIQTILNIFILKIIVWLILISR